MRTPHLPDGADIVSDHEERIRKVELRPDSGFIQPRPHQYSLFTGDYHYDDDGYNEQPSDGAAPFRVTRLGVNGWNQGWSNGAGYSVDAYGNVSFYGYVAKLLSTTTSISEAVGQEMFRLPYQRRPRFVDTSFDDYIGARFEVPAQGGHLSYGTHQAATVTFEQVETPDTLGKPYVTVKLHSTTVTSVPSDSRFLVVYLGGIAYSQQPLPIVTQDSSDVWVVD